MPATKIADVLGIHDSGLKRMTRQIWPAVDAQRDLSSQQVCATRATRPQFDPCQGTELVHLLGHQGMSLDVRLIPKTVVRVGQIV